MIRVLELFGGYGSQALALENLGIEFTSDLCDNDKYAVKTYNQLHGETFNYGDICTIDETKLPYYDLITYSSPCQDFSVAGKQAGGEKGSGTRSSLLWECERIIRAVKPKYLLMENVKALTSKKFMPLFAQWLRTLESMGYKNYWKVLNAKDYGVPQNRERVFVVSILGGGKYQFPNPIPLTKRLKDVLEPVVDEKYYISKSFDFVQKDVSNTIRCGGGGSLDKKHTWDIVKEPIALDEQNGYIRKDGCVGTLTTDGSSPKHNNRVVEPKVINPLSGKSGYGWHFEQEVYDEKGIARAVKAGGGSGNIPKVIQEPINLCPHGDNPQSGRVYNSNGLSPAMDTCQGGNRMPKITERSKNGFTNKRIYSLLRILWKKIREKQIWEEIGRFRCVPEKEILQQRMYEAGDAKNWKEQTELFKLTFNSKGNKQIVVESGLLRDMWEKNKIRRPSQRWGLSEQQYRELDCFMQKLPHEDTSSKEKMYCVWESSEGIELLRETLSEIQKVWKSFDFEQGTQSFGYRIRKLTPRECWRLQGVRDYQFDKLHDISNAQLYKMAGNSIVVDVLMAIFKNLFMPNEQEQYGQLTLF